MNIRMELNWRPGDIRTGPLKQPGLVLAKFLDQELEVVMVSTVGGV